MEASPINKPRKWSVSKVCDLVLGIIAVIAGMVVARWIFHESGHGLDFQDESFALLVAEHPDEYRLLPTRVGYFLQPFYLLAQRDIPLLRQFSYLLLTLGLYLNFHFARNRFCADRVVLPERLTHLSAASVLAAFSWIARGGTCRTLDYNQQTAILLLFISAAVLCWLVRGPDTSRKFNWCHATVGFLLAWLSFVKPSAAIALLPSMGLVLFLLGFLRGIRNVVGLAVGAGILLVPYFLFIESPWALLGNFRAWQEHEAVLQSSHGLLDATKFAFRETLEIFRESLRFFGKRFFACTILLGGLFWWAGTRWNASILVFAGLVLLPIAATYGSLAAFAATFSHSFSGSFALALSLLVAAVLHGVLIVRGSQSHFLRNPVFVWCLFMSVASPFLYSYGSNVAFQSRAGGAATLYLGFSVLLLFEAVRNCRLGRYLIPTTATCMFAFYLMPKWRNPSPDTGPSYFLEDFGAGTIRLPAQEKLHMEDFKSVLTAAKKNGWKSGTEVLDLWGRFPGITYLLQGRPPRWPWYMSTYEGATRFTHMNLESLDADRLRALWLIEAFPAVPHIRPEGAPLPVGGFPVGYNKVGEFRFQETSSSPVSSVRLWKPK